MQQLTFPKFLILAIATYLTVSGKSCEWFRSLRHGLRRHFQEPSSAKGGFHLRSRQQPEALHNSQITHQDSTSTTNRVASGIWFSKSIELIDDIEDSLIQFQFDEEHCNDNECHYELGDVVSLDYQLSSTLDNSSDETPIVEGSFLINDKFSWTFSCQLCGQGCDLALDELSQDLDISIDMGDCDADKKGSLSFSLSSSSQDLAVKAPMVLQGDLHFFGNTNSQPKELLAQIGMDATIA